VRFEGDDRMNSPMRARVGRYIYLPESKTSDGLKLADGTRRRLPDFISATRGPGMRVKRCACMWCTPTMGICHATDSAFPVSRPTDRLDRTLVQKALNYLPESKTSDGLKLADGTRRRLPDFISCMWCTPTMGICHATDSAFPVSRPTDRLDRIPGQRVWKMHPRPAHPQ
jgi:hypothetical protein